MSKESYVYHRNCRPSTLGSVTFAQNKSTFARPKNFKTLVFIMPKYSTKQLYKGNFWYFLTTKIHFLMAFLHLELLLSWLYILHSPPERRHAISLVLLCSKYVNKLNRKSILETKMMEKILINYKESQH